MPDRRPPRFAGDERQTLLELLRYHRESVVRKVSGLADETAASVSAVASGTTLLWLVDHLAHAELLWVAHRFAGGDEPVSHVSTSVGAAVARYQQAWTAVDGIIAGAGFDDPCAIVVHGDSTPVNLRWVVTHLLEETARHAGHADILRELVDGSTGR